MLDNKLIKFSLIVGILLLMPVGSSAQITATWQVDTGDSAIYWIDELQITQNEVTADLTPLLGTDANRTSIFAVTSKTANSLNYSLGLNNGSEIIPNQQTTITKFEVGSSSLNIPNGSLPIALPTSIEGYSNYLQHLASSTSIANLGLSNILSSFNITAADAGITAIYRSDFLNISATATLFELEDLTTNFFTDVNDTGVITLGENQTINDIDTELLISYNSENGLLEEFSVDAAINTTVTNSEGQEINSIITFNTTIIQQRFIPFEETLDNLSSNDGISFLVAGSIPALVLLRRRKN